MKCCVSFNDFKSKFIQEDAPNLEKYCLVFNPTIKLSDPEVINKIKELVTLGVVTQPVIDRIDSFIAEELGISNFINGNFKKYTVTIPDEVVNPMNWLTGYASGSINVTMVGKVATVVAKTNTFNCPSAVEISVGE